MNTDINENDMIRHKETNVFYLVKRITTEKLVDLNHGKDRKLWIEGIDGGDTKTLFTIQNCDDDQEITEHQLMMQNYEKV